MKNFIIGLIIGIVCGGLGGYTYLKENVEKITNERTIKKATKATKTFVNDIGDAVK